MANTVVDFTGAAFAFQSCEQCTVSENIVDRTIGVVKVGISEEVRLNNLDSGVLPYSSGLVVRGNIARFPLVDFGEAVYLGQSCYATFIVNGREAQNLTIEQNTITATRRRTSPTNPRLFGSRICSATSGWTCRLRSHRWRSGRSEAAIMAAVPQCHQETRESRDSHPGDSHLEAWPSPLALTPETSADVRAC